MIERYARREMMDVWDAEARIRGMLNVELAWLEVIGKRKRVPARQLAELRKLIKKVREEGE